MVGDELADFLTLSKGLPVHSMDRIISWYLQHYSVSSGGFIYSLRLVEYQSARRKDFRFRDVGLVKNTTFRETLHKLGPVELTYFVDYAVSKHKSRVMDGYLDGLAKILRESGAGWEVVSRGDFDWRLQEVVPGGVVRIADEALSGSDRASALLITAWENAFGVARRPSHAYYDAVRAVEILSCPLISPRDQRATLGKDINVLRNSADKFEFVLPGSEPSTSGVEHLVSCMQLLWHSQSDRHGRADYADVTDDQAQAAVFLAATLVGWLSRSFLRRKID
jgi:hypothetical protein